MKTIRLLALAIVAWLCCAGISAQVAYPKDMFAEEMAIQVKYKGAQPTIINFISSYFDSDEEWPEIWGTCRDAWKAHIARKRLEKGCNILLDSKNGFMQFTQNLKEAYGDDFTAEDKYYIEMCYWNCADKKHKVFAVSMRGKERGKWTNGQYDGVTFYVYNNKSRKMYHVPSEDLGITIDYKNVGDIYPVHAFILPREGKDVIQETYLGDKKTERHFKWDGMRFK